MNITLTKDLKTGIQLIDNQHEEYIRRLNILLSKSPDEKMSREELDFVIGYAAEHFDAEEALMDYYAYPDKQKHVAFHEYFRETADVLINVGYENFNMTDLTRLLVNWFLNHIRNQDFELADFIRSKKENHQ